MLYADYVGIGTKNTITSYFIPETPLQGASFVSRLILRLQRG